MREGGVFVDVVRVVWSEVGMGGDVLERVVDM